MTLIIKLNNKWLPGCKFALSLVVLLLASIVVFSGFYLFSSHQYLVKWYYGLNSCFYQNQSWGTDFFTPGIKSDGNMYCIIAILIALAGIYYAARSIKNDNNSSSKTLIIPFDLYDAMPVIACTALAVILWYIGNRGSYPAHDEIFSAQNAAGIHPFQTISYYMLPNNHILYNFLNGVLFHSFSDKVATGRVISLVAFYGVTLSLFYWLKSVLQHQWLALLVVVALALQCPVWGFSYQARGYELYLLAEWGMAISLFQYLLSSKQKWLYLNAVCMATGYFCIPSFLYMHAAQLVFMLLYMLVYKTKETIFWKYQAVGLLLTYLLYLPALCFSGLAALANNTWVAPMAGFKNKGLGDFLQFVVQNMQLYITHLFSDIHWQSFSFNLLLFMLPLALLWSKRNKGRFLLGLLYVTMWILLFIAMILMKRMPFERNLIGHYSITLAGVLLTVHWLSGLPSNRKTAKIIGWILFPASMVLLSVHFIQTNDTYTRVTLYEYDVNKVYNDMDQGLNYFPPGSSVAFSDQDFFYYYICMKKGYSVSKCPSGNEDYIMQKHFETLPAAIAGNYTFVKDIGDNKIYKKNLAR